MLFSIAFKINYWLLFKILPSFEMHSSIILTLTSIIKLWGWLMWGKPPVSWSPLWKGLCQCWIIHFAKHFSLYTSHSKVHVSSISFPNRTQKLIAARCLERMSIFSLFHSPINTCVDLPRLPPLLYSPYTVPPCLVRKIYSFPIRLCASEHFTLFLSFSTVHSPQCLIARRGLSTCSYKTHHILSVVSCSELVPCSFDAYWTTEHNHVWE